MKTTFWLVLFVAALPLLAPAQTTLSLATNSAAASGDVSVAKWLPSFTNSLDLQLTPGPQPKPTVRIAGVDFTAEGALVEAARAGQIWQALNPFAPARYGNSHDNVNLDPHTGQPNGIVLVSFRFGSRRQR